MSFSCDLGFADPLAALGITAAQRAELATMAGEPGRVVRAERGEVLVAGADGQRRVGLGRDLRYPPTVGDVGCVTEAAPDRAMLTSLVTRTSLLGRSQASGLSAQQALAANVTHALIVVSLAQPPHLGRLERLLALVWPSGAAPVVVLSKTDLCPDLPAVVLDVESAAPGAAVLAVSARTGAGLDRLGGYAGPGCTLALLGTSGAGKSTLANALAQAPVMRVQDIRDDGKGRHTTVNRQLLTLPTGGCLIDTPGLRAVALWAAEDDGLARTFADVEGLAADCRFSDCGHRSEPGCAVLAAVTAGVLAERRVQSWRKLGRELERQALRQDARRRADQGRRWRAAHQPARAPRP